MEILIKPAYDEEEAIRGLFQEYTAMLIHENPGAERVLKVQDYDEELLRPGEKYSLPNGRLYIAKADGDSAGCVCLRKIDDASCEMKRLYVKPQFRGLSIARLLCDRIIGDARAIGYKYMLLDTLPFLKSAVSLYKRMGFYEVSAYNNNPDETAIYMRLDL